MADETQVTETAPVEEKKRGMGVSGVVGAVGGGYGGYKITDNIISKGGIKKALFPEDVKEKKPAAKDAKAEAKDPVFKKGVDEILANEKNAALKTQHEALADFKKLDLTKIDKLEVTEAKDGLHTITAHVGSKNASIQLKKLPKDLAVKTHEGDALKNLVEGDKSAVKTLVADAEKSLTTGVKKASGNFFGFKNTNGGGKAAIIGATIVGAVVGAKVLHAIFGGKHSKKVEEQAQVEAAPAR